MKRLFSLVSFIMIISLTACNLSMATNVPSTNTPSADDLATQVSIILTAMPTATPMPVVEPSATVQVIVQTPTPGGQTPPTDTPVPTETPQVPTNTPEEPTETDEPTETPGPTPTMVPGDPRLNLGNPAWVDNFDNLNNWPSGDDSFTKIELKQDNLVLTALSEVDGWRISWPEVKNYYLEMTATMPNCKGTDHYGLMFRVPEKQNPDQGYLFGITCDGKYSLRMWDDPDMTSLVRWKAHPAVKVGSNAINRIGVWVKGSNIKLYINGSLVTEVSDSSFTAKGGFGLFVGSDEVEDLAVWVSQVAYWDIE